MSRKFGLTAIKFAAAALIASTFVVLAPGCAPECVDKYDCISGVNYTTKSKIQSDGGYDLWTCNAGVCAQGTPQNNDPIDAGP